MTLTWQLHKAKNKLRRVIENAVNSRIIIGVVHRQPFASGSAVQTVIGRKEDKRRQVIGEQLLISGTTIMAGEGRTPSVARSQSLPASSMYRLINALVST